MMRLQSKFGDALVGGATRRPCLKLGFLLSSITSSGNNERMSDHVYKKIEIVGSSPKGFEDAIKNALARAEKTVRNMRWFEVTETRGDVENGKVGHWQVTLKIGFTLEQ
jgi:dodecin